LLEVGFGRWFDWFAGKVTEPVDEERRSGLKRLGFGGLFYLGLTYGERLLSIVQFYAQNGVGFHFT